MTWLINEPRLDSAYLGALEPTRILFDFDGPRTFLSQDSQGDLLFLHQCDASESIWRYFVVPFSETLLADLEGGRLDLRSALDQPRLWVADFDRNGVAALFRIVDRASVEAYLPIAGTMLSPEFEPLLSVRACGQSVELGKAKIGVIGTSLTNIRNALKTLAEYAQKAATGPGQPTTELRRYYDLPVVFSTGSVRVSVLPEIDSQQEMFESVWDRMEKALSRGLNEIKKSVDPSLTASVMDNELRVALKAIYLLTPPSYGAVDTTYISGKLTESSGDIEPVQLTRQTRTSLRQRLQLAVDEQETVVEMEGIISEMDRDESTCMLRNETGKTLLKLSFPDSLYERVKEAFDSQRKVRAFAETIVSTGVANLLALPNSES
jgi:hypothetical protein